RTARTAARAAALLRLVAHVAELLELLELLGVRARRAFGAAGVDVDALGVRGHVAVVRELGIAVLDQVVEGVPLPDDLAADGPHGLDLEHAVGPEAAFEPLQTPAGGLG